jgi:ATP-dependent helicase/nuclease subunit A
MNTSFRSVATVLNVVDQLFATTHKPFRQGEGVFVVMPLIPKHKEDGEKGWKFPSKEQGNKSPHANLAAIIAEQITVWVRNAKRSCKDIMILTKKRSELTWSLGEEFLKRNIPFVYQDKVILSDELLALDLLALLKFVTLPQDDYNLACLLKSPFFNLDEAALFKLCAYREMSLWETLQMNQEFDEIVAKLSSFIQLSEYNNVHDFLKVIIGNELYYQAFQQRFGYKASIIIDLFLRAIALFAENNPLTFLGFTEWFWQNNLEFDLPQSSQDAVRIMTCHAAKGLQAPVVIIADSASTEQVPYSRIYWHADLPLYSLGGSYDHEVLTALKEDRKAHEAEENSRLLYVAMTRAEDELYFAGWDNNRIKNSWYERVATIANVIQNEEMMPQMVNYTKDLINLPYPEFFDKKLESPEEMSFSATVFSPVKTKHILYGEFIHEVLSKYVKLQASVAYDIEQIIEHTAKRYANKIDASSIEAGKNKIKNTICICNFKNSTVL